jgi:predicted transcriptional regulator
VAAVGAEGPQLASGPSGSPSPGERRAAGALEAEILAILREADGPLSPGEVRQRLTPRAASSGPPPGGPESAAAHAAGPRGELSYSTVVTIVSRLHAKGLLARQRAGRGFTYTPVDEASLAATRMSQVLGSEHDHDAVLSRFVSGLSSRDTRLLRELLGGDTGPAGGDPGVAAGEQG